MSRRSSIAFAALALAACATDRATVLAAHGDIPGLRALLEERAARGRLDDATVRGVSRALIDHDLERSAGPEAEARVRALTPCARPLRDTLRRLASRDDDIAPAAAGVLVDVGLVEVDTFTDSHRDDARPNWRAVATRGLVAPKDARLRAARAIDDDRVVRRAAVAAAGDAGAREDLPTLLEAARRDPDALVRVEAVRGVARLASRLPDPPLRSDTVDRLADLWAGGDEGLRGAIAWAYATPALLDAGGRRELQRVVATSEGHVAVEAAAALMAAGSSVGEEKLARLARDTEGQEKSVRAHALRLLDAKRPAHLDALRLTLEDAGDPVARAVAAEALLRLPVAIAAKLPGKAPAEILRADASRVLHALAARTDGIGVDAAAVLAEEGFADVRARLVGELSPPASGAAARASARRVRVAAALVRIGQAADVRGLLANGDFDLRDRVACAVLSTQKR